MSILKLVHLSKSYLRKNASPIEIFNDLNYQFPNTGIVAIVGKSGCGKSTLLNIIASIDKPTSGDVIYAEQSVNKFKEKRLCKYRNDEIGILFQSYNLIEDETGLYNIQIPMLLKGKSKSESAKYIKSICKRVNIEPDLLDKKVNLLSGGEKQIISLLRAIINNPRLVLCDEPTGALDEVNSVKLMDILLRISERKLIIVVSHNDELMRKYADEIIDLTGGKLRLIKKSNKEQINLGSKNSKYHLKKNLINHISWSNFKRRKKRNLLSIISLSIGLISSLLVLGFNNGYEASAKNETYRQFDYGAGTVSKESSNSVGHSILSLTRSYRPTKAELEMNRKQLANFIIEPNFDALLTQNVNISCQNVKIDGITLSPIYSFEKAFVNQSLLCLGRNVSNNANEVLINDSAYNLLKSNLSNNPINSFLNVDFFAKTKYLPPEENSNYIIDDFEYSNSFKIVGVVKELSFLQVPKIFYSYRFFCDVLANITVSNYSNYKGSDISWYQRVNEAYRNDTITSYSYRLFLKNSNFEELECLKPILLSVNFNSLQIADTFLNLFSSMSLGMEIFLIVSLFGTALIIGIVSVSSYTDDKKRSAILSSLGLNRDSIFQIYINENFIVGLLAASISFIVAPLLALLINAFVKPSLNLNNLIVIPFNLYNIPCSLIVIVLFTLVLIILSATLVPIIFSKKISIKDELQSI